MAGQYEGEESRGPISTRVDLGQTASEMARQVEIPDALAQLHGRAEKLQAEVDLLFGRLAPVMRAGEPREVAKPDSAERQSDIGRELANTTAILHGISRTVSEAMQRLEI
jgi:hypothetical protein